MPCGTVITDQPDVEANASMVDSTTTGTGSATKAVDYKLTEGRCIRNYHKRRRAGELIEHTVFRQVEYTGSADGRYSINDTYNTYHIEPRWIYAPRFLTENEFLVHRNEFDAWEDDGELIQAAYADAYSKFDALTFIAELHKTISMFFGLTYKVLNFADSYGKGSNAERLKNLANDYLEGRYGWRVLYYEMRSFEEALRETLYRELDIVKGRASAAHPAFTKTSVYNHDFGYAGFTQTVTDVVTISERASAALQGRFSSFLFNPILTAWELITFSFVVDWFIRIGQLLAAISADILAVASTASTGYKIDVKRTVVSSDTWFQSPRTGSLWSNSESEGYFVYRSPGSVSFLPQIDVNLNPMKILDLIALIIQRTSGR